ncbi:dual specificity protein phosphatase 12 isoform X1 [Pristis pectinata]|uniref:dual specificity protein phosphatase 12 isoform X1 n=1 Tax=Pristis pectinata TaxID=685728 RepID=UPI00223C9CEA|nr:dual specificity protein phosphatase 12 isoform X1 [Pristis pectinata]
MILVRSGLLLGSASDLVQPQSLSDRGISHVLTVDSQEPPPLGNVCAKFVQALDEPCTDLLSFLDECVGFVQQAQGAAGAAVLVHCHAGVSRSAAVVTAFIMKTDNLSFEEAYSKLKAIKPDVRINDEFVKQLKLYEVMGCKVDLTSADYKQYRLQKVTEKYPELQNLPRELFALDPMSLGKTSEAIYRCRKCRRCLFRGSSNLTHVPGTGPAAFAHKRLTQTRGGDHTRCTSYFIEPVQWMEPSLLGVLDGQLLCPKCNCKLGSFNWYGDQCSCGRWVTPAFQIHKNRVDEMKHLNFLSVGNVNS